MNGATTTRSPPGGDPTACPPGTFPTTSAQAGLKERIAYQLRTERSKAIYRLHKCTVEPVIGVIKEVLDFRQFSLRGAAAAVGAWCLVFLACNLKRVHRLTVG